MIISKIFGGLGNQMFQYSFGKYLSIKNNDVLFFDTSFYKTRDKKRRFSLNVFYIDHNKIATRKEILVILGIYNNRIIKKIAKMINVKNKYLLEEKSFEFNDKFKKCKEKNVYLDGYFQSEKYFKEIDKIIKDDFHLKDGLLGEQAKMIKKNILKKESVSIHIRRGDYISNPVINKYHGVLTLEYYQKAINIIKSKTNNPVFYVFSDDTEWCKNNLNNLSNDLIFIEKQKDYEDLELMKNCTHNIIANSSFSWWGAWLNENPNKIVIAPKNWFSDKTINTNDLIPETWIKI